MNIYLVVNSSYHILNKEVEKIIKENEVITINYNNSSIQEILNEASYMSLGLERKYIVVSNASCFSGKLEDNEQKLLEQYLDNPNQNSTLIFTCNNADMRKKIVKTIKEKYSLIKIPEIEKKDITNFVINEIKKLGFLIDYKEAQFIVINSKYNIDIIYNELEKLKLYYQKNDRINYYDLEKIVGVSIEDSNFKFVESVVSKNLGKSIKIFNDLKKYKVEPNTLIILLAREYRLMYYIKIYQKEKKNKNEICSLLSLQDWQLEKMYTNSLKYNEKELLEIIEKLSKIDINIKSGIFDKEVALMMLLIELCE